MLLLKLSLALQLVLSSTNKLIKHSKSLPQLSLESKISEIQKDTHHGKIANTTTILENVNNTTEKPLKPISQLNPNAQEFFPRKNILTELSTWNNLVNIIANFLDGKSQVNLVKVNKYLFDNYAEITKYTIPVGFYTGLRCFHEDKQKIMFCNKIIHRDLAEFNFMKFLEHEIREKIINHEKLSIIRVEEPNDEFLGDYLDKSILYLEENTIYDDESHGLKLELNIDDNLHILRVTKISDISHQKSVTKINIDDNLHILRVTWDPYNEITYYQGETSYRTVYIIRFRKNYIL